MRQLNIVTGAMEFTAAMNHEGWYRMDAGLHLMFWYMSVWLCLLNVRTKNRLKPNLKAVIFRFQFGRLDI